MPRRLLTAAALVAMLAAAGCGGHEAAGPPRVSVALDFVPNAMHAPIFTAVRTGADRRHGERIVIALRLDRGVVERWADFDARIGILPRRPDVSRAFAFDLGRG